MRIIYLLNLINCLFFLSGNLYSQVFINKEIPSHLKTDADAVVRYYSYHYEVIGLNETKTTITKVVTVLNKDGVVHGHFNTSTPVGNTIQLTYAIVYDKEGKVIEKMRDKNTFRFLASDDDAFMQDEVVKKVMPLTHKEFPYTTEVSYEIKEKGSMFYPLWVPQNDLYVSVEAATFQLTIPSYISLKYQSSLLSDAQVFNTNKTSIYKWKVLDLKALKAIPYAPPVFERMPSLILSPDTFVMHEIAGSLKDWNSFGRWNANLHKGRANLPPELVLLMNEKVSHCKSNLDSLEALYKLLQNHCRYLSIQLGIGGWQPAPVKETFSKGYGDCKALSFMLVAMLNYYNIEAYYTIIRAGDELFSFQQDFAHPRFNHVVVCAPNNGDTLWIECTEKYFKLGYYGNFIANRNALIIKQNNGELLTVKPLGHNENKYITKLEYTLTEAGEINGTLHKKSMGYFFEIRQKRFKDQKGEKYKDFILKNYFGRDVIIKASENKDLGNLIEEEVGFMKGNYARISKEKSVFNLFPTQLYSMENVCNGSRNEDIYIPRSYSIIDTLIIHLPNQNVSTITQQNKKIENEFGSLTIQIKQSNQEITLVREMQINRGRYTASLTKSFCELIKQNHQLSMSEAILTVKNTE